MILFRETYCPGSPGLKSSFLKRSVGLTNVGKQRKADGPMWAARREDHPKLLAWAFCCCLSLGHLFPHLGFDGIKIEARAPLHRRVFEERLDCLTHHLLDE